MSYGDAGKTGRGSSDAWRNDGGVQPHAFDPDFQPELFRGVLTRRVFAFLIDLVVLSIPVILAYVFIFVFGVVTLGLDCAPCSNVGGPRCPLPTRSHACMTELPVQHVLDAVLEQLARGSAGG